MVECLSIGVWWCCVECFGVFCDENVGINFDIRPFFSKNSKFTVLASVGV